MFLGFFLMFFFHIACCFFVIIPQLMMGDDSANHDDVPLTWLAKYFGTDDSSPEYDRKVYVTSLYFVITTVATVGYGDISPTNWVEQIYCIFLMIFGVLLFTFVSGALSSILSNYDAQQAQLQEKLLYLNKLRM